MNGLIFISDLPYICASSVELTVLLVKNIRVGQNWYILIQTMLGFMPSDYASRLHATSLQRMSSLSSLPDELDLNDFGQVESIMLAAAGTQRARN